jgi:peptidoglycan hydrolase CwlO-like protein
MRKIFTLFLISLLGLFLIVLPVRGDEISDLQKQIDELNKARQMSIDATKPLEGQLVGLKKQLDQIRTNLVLLGNKIKQREKDIDAREERLATQQALLEARVRSYYISSYMTNPLVIILSSQSSAGIFRELSYRLAATKEDQRVISSVTNEITDLLTQKEKLEKDTKILRHFIMVKKPVKELKERRTRKPLFMKNKTEESPFKHDTANKEENVNIEDINKKLDEILSE